MDTEDSVSIAESLRSIATSLEHLSNATYTGFDGGVFLRIAGDPIQVNVKELQQQEVV